MRRIVAVACAAMAAAPLAPASGLEGPSLDPPSRVETASGLGPARSVAVFYYAWYGTPDRDGGWQHWSQNGHSPPASIGTRFYPARGPYSSSNPRLVRAHMREIASTGADTVAVSWWGTGSVEDLRLPLVIAEARAAGLAVAIHVEPYPGRTPASVVADIERLERLGVRDFYVYDSTVIDDAAWSAALRDVRRARVFANTSLVGKARAGGFNGIYTYDVLINSGRSFRRICAQARAAGLLCAPSVGPGFDAGRATAIAATRPRLDGVTYDTAWRAAVAASPDVVTVTSYNEWHEGTQIEPARAADGYASYEGAWGRRGAGAETAYLDRTRAWIRRLRGGTAPPAGAPVPLEITR